MSAYADDNSKPNFDSEREILCRVCGGEYDLCDSCGGDGTEMVSGAGAADTEREERESHREDCKE